MAEVAALQIVTATSTMLFAAVATVVVAAATVMVLCGMNRYISTLLNILKRLLEPMGSTSILSALARRLEGKVALITGGASGIGECTAKLFSQHGAKVVIADIQDELGQSVCKDIGPASASYVHCDVTNELQVQNAVDTAVANYGKLDIMFNNAGIVDEPKARIIDNEMADFEKVLKVNVTGVFLGTKHAARVMIPARQGSIISTASISSIIGGSASHAYTCSKHAVLGLTRNAAVELGQFGIRVNCMSPYALVTPLAKGFVKLEDEDFENRMHELGNLKGVTLKTEDVARAALYLGSDDSKYVSGHNLLLDGGFTAVNPSFGMFKYPDS
ncbi:Short-chain dehydrogenase/reductase SDR [Macleaya cordata]|uniref:Secoisolariciresinol dehydrogenase n=1 Tax=Macleaya cordata TaxID=56857 RepID=A0A200QVC5_MACCD|nr:Short-chain dehydrogenase/reductase SDR [Macleaya cordata]